MRWEVAEIENSREMGVELFRLWKHHRLLPENTQLCVDMIRQMAVSGDIWTVAVDGDIAAQAVLCNIYRGDQATLDILIIPRTLKQVEGDERVSEVLAGPLFKRAAEYGLQRISCLIPVSRSRTKRIVKALGFRSEGRLRSAWKPIGKPREDVLAMAWLTDELRGD